MLNSSWYWCWIFPLYKDMQVVFIISYFMKFALQLRWSNVNIGNERLSFSHFHLIIAWPLHTLLGLVLQHTEVGLCALFMAREIEVLRSDKQVRFGSTSIEAVREPGSWKCYECSPAENKAVLRVAKVRWESHPTIVAMPFWKPALE